MTRDEFRVRLATAAGRQELGLELSAEDAALVLADDGRLDALHAEVEARLGVREPPEALADESAEAATAEEVTAPRRRKVPRWTVISVVAVVVVSVCVLGTVFGIHQATAKPSPSHLAGDRDGDGKISAWDTEQPNTTSDSANDVTSDTSAESDSNASASSNSVNGLTFDWVDTTGQVDPCGYQSYCVVLAVHATQTCSSVYAEAQVLDASGTVVGMANGTLPALNAGDNGRLILGWTERDGTQGKLTQLTCW